MDGKDINMKNLIYILIILFISNLSRAQWTEQISGITSALWSVSAVDNNVVWICGGGGKVLRTTNGGANWDITTSPNSSLNLYSIWAVNDSVALVAGSGNAAIVYKTVNSGNNWSQVYYQYGGYINAISGYSLSTDDTLFMCGDPLGNRWQLWKSTNMGTSWDSTGLFLPVSGSEAGYWNSLYCLRGKYNEIKIWFGTNNTRIYKYSYGQNWTSQPTTGSTSIFRILFADSQGGVAGGESRLLFTSNGGQNWILSGNIPGSGWIIGLARIDGLNMFYARNNSIYRTTNGGINWVLLTSQAGNYYHMIKARTGNNIWAVRDNGGISKYTYTIDIKPISSEIPEKYSLLQNYPNPFNMTTNIKYALLMNGFVKLAVFDILGKELEILVNEKQNAGTYELSFDAARYSSGIYLYKFSSGDYTDVKRMVLVK